MTGRTGRTFALLPPATTSVIHPPICPNTQLESLLLPCRAKADHERLSGPPMQGATIGPAEGSADHSALAVDSPKLKSHFCERALPRSLYEANRPGLAAAPVQTPVEIHERMIGGVKRKVLRTVGTLQAGTPRQNEQKHQEGKAGASHRPSLLPLFRVTHLIP